MNRETPSPPPEDEAAQMEILRAENTRLLEQVTELKKISKKWEVVVSARANYWITTQGMPLAEARKRAEKDLLSRGLLSIE